MPCGQRTAEGHPAGNHLAEVQHQLVGGGGEQLHGSQLLRDAHGHAEPFRQAALGRRRDLRTLPVAAVLQPRVVALAVVNAAEGDGGGAAFPGFVRGDNRLRAVGVGDAQLAYQLHPVAVEAAAGLTEAVAAHVPAAAQHDGQLVVLLEHVCHVIGLVLDEVVVAVVIRGEILVRHPPAVEAGLIQPQAADVQPGGGHGLPGGEAAAQHRMDPAVPGHADPLTGPGLVQLAGLEEGRLGQGGFAVVRRDAHLPEVAGAGRKGDGRGIPQGGEVPLAAVVEDAGHAGVGSDDDAGGTLLFAGSVRDLPAQDGLHHGCAQGAVHVHGAKMGDLHGCISFLFKHRERDGSGTPRSGASTR